MPYSASDWTAASKYTDDTKAATAQATADTAKSAATQTASDLSSFVASTNAAMEDMQGQIDGSITTWFYEVAPTTTNVPASNWTTTDAKNQHLGDVYYDTQTGYTYRWQVVSNAYSWQRITDVDVTKALADAATAQDTADSKRRVFTATPTPPYDVGDLWSQGSDGDIMRCTTAKAEGLSYLASDWTKASKYTDDTLAQAAKEEAVATANYFMHDSEGAHVTSASGDATTGKNLLMASGKIGFRDGTAEIGLIDVTTVEGRNLMRLMCGDSYDGILLDGGAYVVSKQHVADDTYGAYGSYVTCGMHETGAPRASMVAHRGDGTLAHPYDVEAELDVGVVDGSSYINATADSFKFNAGTVLSAKVLSSAHTMNTAVTLSESAANFTKLELFCYTNDGHYFSQSVWNPDGKSVVCSCAAFRNGAVYVKTKTFTISGTTINTLNDSEGYNRGEWGSGGSVQGIDVVGIDRVVGYR